MSMKSGTGDGDLCGCQLSVIPETRDVATGAIESRIQLALIDSPNHSVTVDIECIAHPSSRLPDWVNRWVKPSISLRHQLSRSNPWESVLDRPSKPSLTVRITVNVVRAEGRLRPLASSASAAAAALSARRRSSAVPLSGGIPSKGSAVWIALGAGCLIVLGCLAMGVHFGRRR